MSISSTRSAIKGKTIGARCQQAFLDELDAWRQRQLIPPSRAGALRQLAEIGLRLEAATKGQEQPADLARRAAFVVDQDRRRAAMSRAGKSANKQPSAGQ